MKTILLLLALLLVASVAHGETFGNEAAQSGTIVVVGDQKWAFRFQMNAETGTATKLHFRANNNFNAVTHTVTGAIYSDNSDDPLTLLATSTTTVNVTGSSFADYVVDISYALESEVWYWITMHHEGSASMILGTSGAGGNRKFNNDALPLEETFSAGGNGTENGTIWIEYTTGGAAAAWQGQIIPVSIQ